MSLSQAYNMTTMDDSVTPQTRSAIVQYLVAKSPCLSYALGVIISVIGESEQNHILVITLQAAAAGRTGGDRRGAAAAADPVPSSILSSPWAEIDLESTIITLVHSAAVGHWQP